MKKEMYFPLKVWNLFQEMKVKREQASRNAKEMLWEQKNDWR